MTPAFQSSLPPLLSSLLFLRVTWFETSTRSGKSAEPSINRAFPVVSEKRKGPYHCLGIPIPVTQNKIGEAAAGDGANKVRITFLTW